MPTEAQKQAVAQFQKDIAIYGSPQPAATKTILNIVSQPTTTTSSRTSTSPMTPGRMRALRLKQAESLTLQKVGATLEKIEEARPEPTVEQPAPVVQVQEKREAFMTTTKIAAQQAELQRASESIVPSGTYTYQGQEITGTQAKSIISQQQTELTKTEKQVRLGEIELQRTISQYPSSSLLTKTPEGYSIRIPESEQLRFSSTSLKRTESSPPVIREIQQGILGISSMASSVLKPLASVTGRGSLYDVGASIQTSIFTTPTNIVGGTRELIKTQRYGVHYVSPIDIAFEPIGWSPKGSTNILTKYPAFTAGGLVGEGLYGWAAGKPIGAIGGAIAKKIGLARKIKIKTFYPSEQSKPTISLFKATKEGLELKGVSGTRTTLYKTPLFGHVKVGTRTDRLLFKGVWSRVPKETKKLTPSILQPGGKQIVGWVERTPTSLSATKLERALSSVKGIFVKRATLTETFAKLTMTKADDITRGTSRWIGIPMSGPTYGIYSLGGTTTVALSRGGMRTIQKPIVTTSTKTSLTPALTTTIGRTQTISGGIITSQAAKQAQVSRLLYITIPTTVPKTAPAHILSRLPTRQQGVLPSSLNIDLPSQSRTPAEIRIPMPATNRTTIPVQIPGFASVTAKATTPISIFTTATTTRITTKTPTFVRPTPVFKIPYIPMPLLGPGRGPWSWGEGGALPKYKFRKFDIGGLLK